MLETIKTKDGRTTLTTGYQAVERLIDSEDFAPINDAFEKAYGELAELARHKRGLRKSREARKAMKAMDKVVELLKELLEIKYRLQEALKRAQKRV